MKNKLKLILLWIIITIITYLFLSLVNYSFELNKWNGFSRFILAFEGVIFLLNLSYKL